MCTHVIVWSIQLYNIYITYEIKQNATQVKLVIVKSKSAHLTACKIAQQRQLAYLPSGSLRQRPTTEASLGRLSPEGQATGETRRARTVTAVLIHNNGSSYISSSNYHTFKIYCRHTCICKSVL